MVNKESSQPGYWQLSLERERVFRMTYLHINYMKYFRAFIGLPIYSATDIPAMPLPIEHAHFGGFFMPGERG
jgi:hypothetical protein